LGFQGTEKKNGKAGGGQRMKLDGVVMGIAEDCQLNPEPISEQCILQGKPVARSKVVARTRDWSSSVVIWDCTAGSFRWHYGQDEVIVVVAGDMVLLLQDGTERRISAGDYVFFPAGSVAQWRVDHYIRKVALLKEPMWRPIGFAMKVWNKILRTFGITARVPLGAS
jgi:uncharacterized cupin superfamily protein